VEFAHQSREVVLREPPFKRRGDALVVTLERQRRSSTPCSDRKSGWESTPSVGRSRSSFRFGSANAYESDRGPRLDWGTPFGDARRKPRRSCEDRLSTIQKTRRAPR